MTLRPSIELLLVLSLGAFVGLGYRTLTNPETYLPEAAPHAGLPFEKLVLLAGPTGIKGRKDGKGEEAQFNSPRGTAIDHVGNLFVLDTGNQLLRKVQPDGTVSTVADLSGEISARTGGYPDGIVIDPQGNVLIAEAANHIILKVSQRGDKTVLAGQRGQAGFKDGNGNTARFNSPAGLALDAGGNILVADAGNNSIRQITPAGVVNTLAGDAQPGTSDGPAAKARFAGPWGLALGAKGQLYIAECAPGPAPAACAIRLLQGGHVSTVAANAKRSPPAQGSAPALYMDAPGALVVDAQGLVTYAWQGNIQRLQSDGDHTLHPSASTLHPAPQNLAGLAEDAHGNLFAADALTDYVIKVTPQAEFSDFAGSSDFIGGTAAQNNFAGLDQPVRVRSDSAGNIFVLYAGSHTIRKLTQDLKISGTLNKLVDDGKVKFSHPQQQGPYQMAPGTARLFRIGDLEKALGFRLFSLDLPADGSYTVAPSSNTFAIDDGGNIFVPQTCGAKNEGCVVKIPPQGNPVIFSHGYLNITDIEADHRGFVYIYDAVSQKKKTNQRWLDHIVQLDAHGNFVHATNLDMAALTPAAATKGKPGKPVPNQETAMMVAGSGDIYVADQTSVRRISPFGDVLPLAGDGSNSGSVDAQGKEARFDQINGVAFGKQGNVYVSEGGSNNALRQIAPDGTVSTLVNGKGEGSMHFEPEKTGALNMLRGLAALPDGNLVLLNRYTVLKTE